MRITFRLLAATLTIAVTPLIAHGPSAVAATPTGAPCTGAQVSLSATPSQSNYSSGTTVRVTVAMHNHSATACSYATGPFSPDFVLTNSAGHTVWASCWFAGIPAPCAEYLMHRTLAPGATYRDQLSWDQRSGHPDHRVPAGVYNFEVSVTGIALRATTHIVLGRSRTINVTLGDSGRHYVLAPGDLMSVRLLALPLVWTTAVVSNPRVLEILPEKAPVAGIFVVRALALGTAHVSAVGNPKCYPQCLMPSRLFYVTVTVRAP